MRSINLTLLEQNNNFFVYVYSFSSHKNCSCVVYLKHLHIYRCVSKFQAVDMFEKNRYSIHGVSYVMFQTKTGNRVAHKKKTTYVLCYYAIFYRLKVNGVFSKFL